MIRSRRQLIFVLILIFAVVTLLFPFIAERHIGQHRDKCHTSPVCQICLQIQLYRITFVSLPHFVRLLLILSVVYSARRLFPHPIQSPTQLKVRMNN